jgi:FkbM family methyltransferase
VGNKTPHFFQFKVEKIMRERVKYNFINHYFSNSFKNEICTLINNSKINKRINIFDIGSYLGNFSREIKQKINKKANFHLFDPNPYIKLNDFNYNCLGISNKKIKNYYYNSFFPSSGSGFNKITMNDFFWNLSRKLVTFNIFKKFIKFPVKTISLDNFCKNKNIKEIELLKIDTEGHELCVLKSGQKILSKTKIIQLEIMDKKKLFKKKFNVINNLLLKYNFKLLKLKNIWSVSILSNIKAVDALYVNKNF